MYKKKKLEKEKIWFYFVWCKVGKDNFQSEGIANRRTKKEEEEKEYMRDIL